MTGLPLTGRHLLLAVCGSIAAYKAVELLRLLTAAGATVQVVLSPNSQRFVGAATFQALSQRPVVESLWEDGSSDGMAHIALIKQADGLIVCPASANELCRLAHGDASNSLSAMWLARPATLPCWLAPAMNERMWLNPATQRNIARIVADGGQIIAPERGKLACGEIDSLGRLAEPVDILTVITDYFQRNRTALGTWLITAGPTFEAVDPMRGITNRSSGKMGFALAQAASQAGARVVLIAGPVALATPNSAIKRVDVTSAAQMNEAVLRYVEQSQVLVATAAVADYTPVVNAQQKLKKADEVMVIELKRTVDILASVANSAKRPAVCVGFAAESHDLDNYAQKKLVAKNLDLVVGNYIDETVGHDDACVRLYSVSGIDRMAQASKTQIAQKIVDRILAIQIAKETARVG